VGQEPVHRWDRLRPHRQLSSSSGSSSSSSGGGGSSYPCSASEQWRLQQQQQQVAGRQLSSGGSSVCDGCCGSSRPRRDSGLTLIAVGTCIWLLPSQSRCQHAVWHAVCRHV
jgi:hypothetical protein